MNRRPLGYRRRPPAARLRLVLKACDSGPARLTFSAGPFFLKPSDTHETIPPRSGSACLTVAAGVSTSSATLLASVRTVERGLAGLSEHSVQVDNLEIALPGRRLEKNPDPVADPRLRRRQGQLAALRPAADRTLPCGPPSTCPASATAANPQQASTTSAQPSGSQFAAAIGVRRLHLAGNSMGGHRRAHAARHRNRCYRWR